MPEHSKGRGAGQGGDPLVGSGSRKVLILSKLWSSKFFFYYVLSIIVIITDGTQSQCHETNT